MDKKPFDRFNDKPPRRSRFESREDRFGERSERFEGRGRFSDKDGRFAERGERFEDRPDRFADKGERFRRSERFGDRSERFGRFGDREEGFERRPRFNKPPRRDFGTQSGPRARAFERRRFTDHAAFVKTATVRLDADVAEFFKSAKAVNSALRSLIELSHLITPKRETEQTQSAPEDAACAQPVETESEVAEPEAEGETIEAEESMQR